MLKQLWSDSGVQSCFSGIASSEMAADTKHFLNSAELEGIGQPGYSPTNLDIVRAKRNSPSLNETDCTIGGIGLRITEVEGSLHYVGLVTVPRRHRYMFNIPWRALFLCVSLADYDLKEEDTMQGYMEECLECVQLLSHWSSCYRVNLIPVVVLLNFENCASNGSLPRVQWTTWR